MERPDIRKDQFFQVPIVDGKEEQEFVVSAKYDRIDHYEPLGIWILKILDDKDGLVQAIMEESQARALAKFALLPIVEREFLYHSEHEMFIDAIGERLDEIFGSLD
jgi:hypothetical protein